METKRSRNSAGMVKPAVDRAALELFVRNGVDGTSIKEIAEAAGVAMGALYRHYASKEELVATLFTGNYLALGRQLAQIAHDQPTTRAKLAAIVETCCRLFDEDRVLFSFLLLVQHGQLKRDDNVGLGTPVDAVRAVIGQAVAGGEIAIDADLATALVIGCVAQTATFFIYRRLTGRMTDLAPALADAACRAAGLAV
jgi:AcrR family transcriptional regulator